MKIGIDLLLCMPDEGVESRLEDSCLSPDGRVCWWYLGLCELGSVVQDRLGRIERR